MRDGASARIRRSASDERDPDRLAEILFSDLNQPDLSIVFVFCSSDYDLPALEQAWRKHFADVPLVGCTTAGEISEHGYQDGTTVGISLAAPDFYAVCEPIPNLANFNIHQGHDVVRRTMHRLSLRVPNLRREDVFAMVLIDGLSVCEEAVVSSLHGVLGEIPLFGGSAADSLKFEKTAVLYDGSFHTGDAVLVLVSSAYPFRVFKTEHFVSTDEKMVVTGADPANRVVTEINAEPAAQEYARVVGLPYTELTPMIFASFPVVVRVGGMNFVRSIQKVNEDDSLTFFCAIDEGIVLTAAKGRDITEDLETLFADLKAELGEPQLIIGCDCILRKLELEQKSLKEQIGFIMARNNVVGFSTFGEQYQAMHVNQTFTGVAIGSQRKR